MLLSRLNANYFFINLIILTCCMLYYVQEGLSQDFVMLEGEQVFFPERIQKLCDKECMLDFECLVKSYPKIVTGMDLDDQNRLCLIIYNKKKVVYDDGKKRTYEEALHNGTIKDSMAQIYPLGTNTPIPGIGFAPGRIRAYEFLNAVYGDSESAVKESLLELKSKNFNLVFNKQANASKALENVIQSIDVLLERDPYIEQYVFPIGGTFVWRIIEGENRLSPHSYGIAIDLNIEKGIYWLWTKDRYTYLKDLKEYPRELVMLFEENGFIWGGKWYEFDLMHFEYRPELICKARRLATK